MIKIKTPVPGYNGIDCGVRFENGEATVESLLPHVLAWFKTQGYTVEEDEVQEEVPVIEESTPEADNTDNGDEDPENNDAGESEEPEAGEEKTKAELLEEAKALGIENIRSKATKDEIIQLINDKKVELEALADNGNSDNENPEAGEAGDEDPEKGE